MVTSATATITIADLDKGTDTTSCTQSYSRMLDDDGVQDCDAGHILAHRLGGPGNQPINIFPQVIFTKTVKLFIKSQYSSLGSIGESWCVCSIRR